MDPKMKLETGPNKASSPIALPKKNVSAELLPTTEGLHREMSEWHDEHDEWLKDIHLWQREHKLAELMLHQLECALPHYSRALAKHAENIKQHKETANTYERRLHNFINNGEQDTAKRSVLLKEHQLQEKQHLNEKQRHTSFRDTHQAAMAELKRITKALESTD